MGKLKNMKIDIEGTQPFKPGDIVKGVAVYELEIPIKVEYIKLTISGSSKVKWTTSTSDDEKTYKSYEVYCLENNYMYGQENGKEVSVDPGFYRTPFQITLPATSPSTFHSKHGNIFYMVELCARFSALLTPDDSLIEPFTVVNPIDLANDPATAELVVVPTQMQNEIDNFGCCGLRKQKIQFDIKTDKSAYEPGETVTFNGYVMNSCFRATKSVTLVLRQTVIYYGMRADFSLTSSGNVKTKIKIANVALWKGEAVRSLGKTSYTNRTAFTIPDLPESELRNCKNIDILYEFQFKVCMPGLCGLVLSSDPKPVFIGNNTVTSSGDGLNLAASFPEAGATDPLLDSSAVIVGTSGATSLPPVTISSQPQGGYYDWSQSAFTYS